jgi:D-alanine-D-alanine ligase
MPRHIGSRLLVTAEREQKTFLNLFDILALMQTVVGVLRGGPSREHEVSLKSGASILKHLPQDRFITKDIYIDRAGNWHERGKAIPPERVLRQIDVAVLGLHGEYGEDGQVQRLLEQFGVPFTGSNSLASHLAMHKLLSKTHAQEQGLLTPRYVFAESEEESERIASEATRSFTQPVVVKPVGSGSSVGVSIVSGYAPVLTAIRALFEDGVSGVLVEERIAGKEATAGVVEGLRGEKLYALPVIEIVPPSGDFFSYDAKYSGKTREICPGNISRVEAEELQRHAKVMQRALGLRH